MFSWFRVRLIYHPKIRALVVRNLWTCLVSEGRLVPGRNKLYSLVFNACLEIPLARPKMVDGGVELREECRVAPWGGVEETT